MDQAYIFPGICKVMIGSTRVKVDMWDVSWKFYSYCISANQVSWKCWQVNNEESNEVKQADIGVLVSAEKKWCESFRWPFVEMSNVYCLGYNMWATPLLSILIVNGLCLFSRFDLEYSLYVAWTHHVLDFSKWDTMIFC